MGGCMLSHISDDEALVSVYDGWYDSDSERLFILFQFEQGKKY